MNHPILRLVLACSAGVPLAAQSFVDLTEARNPPHGYSSVLLVEAGAIGTEATPPRMDPGGSGGLDPSSGAVGNFGLIDDISWDGKAYYRNEEFSSRRGTLEAYAGRDGIFAAFTDGKLVGDDTVTRFEARARPWQFYRDGFYNRDDTLVPNGFYDGADYEGYIGFGREAQQGLYVELGPYYKKLMFGKSKLTPPQFSIPDDFSAYGARIYVEQNTVQMDRRRGLPRDGYMFTLVGEREWNDSRGEIGIVNGFTTELPSAVWRLRGRLEWYIPASEQATWEVYAYGGWNDEKDRVENFEAEHPIGNQWADAQLRMRFNLGSSMTLSPFFQLQYSRVLSEDGGSASQNFFYGGGAETYIHFSEALSLHGWYSYVDNENRPSIRVNNDVHGQQMFYLGMVLRLGKTRR
ncbi:MAG TPA: hypothetical protein VFZ65_21700 [Planctomycetota bacterium]|nr:hypothetical protein [Planctomycetota bacterium]